MAPEDERERSQGVESEAASDEVTELAEEADKAPTEQEALEPTPTTIDLMLGEALTSQEANNIACSKRCQLLMIAGPVKSGKTTLIASLFHLFQRGPFSGYFFAGSQTLVGLDKRCFLARIASMRDTMDTDRTLPGTNRKFIHLRLRRQELKAETIDLLLVDLSGEDYREARDSINECRSLALIRSADHLILLVDGGKLIKYDERQKAKNEPIMFLRACVDSSQLNQKSLVDVLFTKWDLVSTSKARDGHIEFIKSVKEQIRDQFNNKLGRLRFHNVAARPVRGNFKLGYGLSEPFRSWVDESPAEILPEKHTVEENQDMGEFDRFFKRRLPNMFERLAR